jgi:hypothetical protein
MKLVTAVLILHTYTEWALTAPRNYHIPIATQSLQIRRILFLLYKVNAPYFVHNIDELQYLTDAYILRLHKVHMYFHTVQRQDILEYPNV